MSIEIRGARTHNLKSVDVSIPTNAIVVITGPSGAGKSSLAFDTLYAEARRRYLEGLSLDLRASGARLPRAEVDAIEGLMPAIALDQRALARSPRSTLGTVTEITDHLRILYARVGTPHCPICGEEVRAETPQEIVDAIVTRPIGTKVVVLAPVARGIADARPVLETLRKDGWVRALIGDTTIDLGEELPKKLPGRGVVDVDVVVDRLVVKEGLRARASDSVEAALRVGGGKLRLQLDVAGEKSTTWHSQRFACEKDDFTFPAIEPALFSFNSAEGACPDCEGLGVRTMATERTLIPDRTRTLRGGAIVAWGSPRSVGYALELKRAVDALGLDADVPFEKLPEPAREALLHGGAGKKKHPGVVAWVESTLEGVDEDEELDRDLHALDALREEVPCATCGGARLRREALAVTIEGRSIADVSRESLTAARAHLAQAPIAARLTHVARPLVEGALQRLDALIEVGLGYLAIDRATSALSAGEAERVRIATQIGGGLRGVLYVLDEPSRGLHPRDTARLLSTLRKLRELGSTVLVVEHDLAIIRAADHLIDVGPNAGAGGGRIVAQGTPDEVARDAASVTGPWLSGATRLPRVKRRTGEGELRLTGVTLRNLRGVDLAIPRGALTTVTGPSGSGKTTLILDALVPALRATIDSGVLPRHVAGLHGHEGIERVVAMDQAPLGRSARSTPATATGVMPKLRELFAALPEARARGYKPARFSSNVKGGRCEACLGEGAVRVEMRFLPDVAVPCSVCKGARYDRETLEVRFKGLSIADVLATSVDDAQRFFESVPAIRERLDAMRAVGLGYLALGQPSPTLSGGEAQRVKLARELHGRRAEATVYVLDEPTTGLHSADVAVLLDALVALRDQGSTIIVIEHDVAFASRADWVIDLGPDAGTEGGRIVAAGTPETVARAPGSATAAPLAAELARDSANR